MATVLQVNGKLEGPPGKSAYQYAQDGGYEGTEDEFAKKLVAEYLTDVQINGTSIVGKNDVANIPYAGTNTAGAVKVSLPYSGMTISNGMITLTTATIQLLALRQKISSANLRIITTENFDDVVKLAMCDGKGAEWTDTEKTGAWERLSAIKTAMDEVAVAGATYILGEQTEVSVVLPDDALTGQEIAITFYNGETPATLSIAGNTLDFDFAPAANTRSEISCLWDGQYWSIIGMSQDVPSEVTESE